MAEDSKGGYRNGDKCPSCGGLVTIRQTAKPGRSIEYAQCAQCSWNTLRD